MIKCDVNEIVPESDKLLFVAAAAAVVEVLAVLLVATVVEGLQKPQASAQRSVTNFLSVKLTESEQAPCSTSVLHVLSSAASLQSVRPASFVEFATHIHRIHLL